MKKNHLLLLLPVKAGGSTQETRLSCNGRPAIASAVPV
jgi:hypothetical protein